MKLLDKTRKKLFKLTSKRPGLRPPTPGEQRLADELRERVRGIEEAQTDGVAVGGNAWEEFRATLRRFILNEDPRDFTNWKVVRGTMFHEADIDELRFLQALPDWGRWSEALEETTVGNPKPYWGLKQSSGNFIHQAYHLARLGSEGGRPVEGMDQVVEFGGGYGAMCRLLGRLGFKGRYVIFDLPEFNALQEYYLKSAGVDSEILRGATDRYGQLYRHALGFGRTLKAALGRYVGPYLYSGLVAE